MRERRCKRLFKHMEGSLSLYQEHSIAESDTPYGVNYERVSEEISLFVVKPVRAVESSDTAPDRSGSLHPDEGAQNRSVLFSVKALPGAGE